MGALDCKTFLQETRGTHLALRESQTSSPGLQSLWPALHLLSTSQPSCCCHGHYKPGVKCPLATAGYTVGWRPLSSTQEMGGGLPWPAHTASSQSELPALRPSIPWVPEGQDGGKVSTSPPGGYKGRRVSREKGTINKKYC